MLLGNDRHQATDAEAGILPLKRLDGCVVQGLFVFLHEAGDFVVRDFNLQRVLDVFVVQKQFHWEAFTTFCAASASESAVMIGRPLSWRIFFPSSTFVPSSRTTSGTSTLTCLTAVRMPLAITSHFMMPPKMLTRMPFTFLSAQRILKASVTCSVDAPPPTSRKLAGEPP